MNYKHGLAHTRLDHIYKNMIARCYNKKSINYNRYGAKGITVCDEWKNDKIKFFEWALSHGYCEDLTLDRINGNLGYEPTNCRWATYKEQANNTKNTVFITLDDVTHSLHEWADILGIKSGTIWARLKRGDSPERALRLIRR
jgi:hypothetical protein